MGYFHTEAEHLARWLRDGLGAGWRVGKPGWHALEDAVAALPPRAPLSRYAILGLDGWAVLMNDGPNGTDVGVLPSWAARGLGIRAIRAVCVGDDGPGYPARILEVYGPGGQPPLAIERSVASVNDGGRWIFEATGEPFDFENTDRHRASLAAERLTCAMIHEYLRALG
ncbi:MAG TPA: hypothetical protein VIH00_04580, partial [Candidatus Limnocylindrales bacterium]